MLLPYVLHYFASRNVHIHVICSFNYEDGFLWFYSYYSFLRPFRSPTKWGLCNKSVTWLKFCQKFYTMQNKTDNINTSLLGSDSFKVDDTFGYSDTTHVSLSVALREKDQEINTCSLPKAAKDDTRHCTPIELYRNYTESPLLPPTGESHSSSIGELTVDGNLVFPWMAKTVKKNKQKSHSICDASIGGGYNRFIAISCMVNGNQRTLFNNHNLTPHIFKWSPYIHYDRLKYLVNYKARHWLGYWVQSMALGIGGHISWT